MIRNCSTLDVGTLKIRIWLKPVRNHTLGPIPLLVVTVFQSIALQVHTVRSVLDAAGFVDFRFAVPVFVDFLDGIVPVLVKVG